MKIEKESLLLNNIKKKLRDDEWEILQFSVIPNLLIEDMLFFRFQKKMGTDSIKQTILKLIRLGIFSEQNSSNASFFVIHDRIREEVINNLSEFRCFELYKVLISYYENYIKIEGIFCNQFYNDKLLCQLILGNNYEWRCCYQAAMENGDSFECQKLLEIYKKSLKLNEDVLEAWYQYYTFQNEFMQNNVPNDINNISTYYERSYILNRELYVYYNNSIGLWHLNQGSYNDAICYFKNALKFANSGYEKIVVLFNICVTLFHKEQYVQSMNLIMDIYADIPNTKFDLFTTVKLKLFQAVVDTRLYNLEQAIWHFKETIDLAKQHQEMLKTHVPLYRNHKDPRPVYAALDKDIYNYMGEVYLTKGDFREAIRYHQMGLSCKEVYEDIWGMAWAHCDLGKVYYLCGDTQIAKEHLDQSCYLFQSSNDKLSIAYPLLEISYVYQYNGDTKLAIESLKESLFLFSKKKSENNIKLVLNHLGRLYQSQGFLKLADKIFNFCLAKLNKYSFTKQTQGWIYNNLARNYLYLSDYDNALLYFQKALNIFEEICEKRGISYIINNIAEVKVKQLKYGEAYQLFMESCHSKEKMGDNHAICYTYRELAELYIEIGQFKEAYLYAKKSLDFCNKGNFTMLKGDIQMTWGNYYTQTQQLDKAWSCYKDALHNYEAQFLYSRILVCMDKLKVISCKPDIRTSLLQDKTIILIQMHSEESRLIEQVDRIIKELS